MLFCRSRPADCFLPVFFREKPIWAGTFFILPKETILILPRPLCEGGETQIVADDRQIVRMGFPRFGFL